MADGRPVELAGYIEAAAEKNDALIVAALGKLENFKTRGKLKVTVSSICTLTGLTRNTIRNREWALKRLKEIKQKLKIATAEKIEGELAVEDEVAIEKNQKKRIKNLLEQNALLYEEVLSLHRIIDRKDMEIKELKIPKLKSV